MKYVLLSDGTRIDDCTDSTTSNSIFAVRGTYEAAGAVRDLFTSENSTEISVYDVSTDEKVVEGIDLILVDGCEIHVDGDDIVCEITTRTKTTEEKLLDEIDKLKGNNE